MEGRSILHNILLCQDIVKHYGKKYCMPSRLLKMDLRKAYDTLNWDFLKDMMYALNFPNRFIKIIMACVTSTQHSLVINGSPLDPFKANQGVRQGDPMSPLLFVIGMEYLSRALKAVGDTEGFSFHPRCVKMKLNHLAFVDDLMMFCKGDLQSIMILHRSLGIFSDSSGLFANNSKSGIYHAGVSNEFKTQAASVLDFSFKSLPVRYLGIPLTSKQYTVADCEYLVDKMTSRIRSWYAKKLSYTARLQLVNSILMSISNYWSQTVIIPKKVLVQINAVCRSYLWHIEADCNSPGNVNWDQVCRPKKEGGLGVRNLQLWNLAAVGKIAWHISTMQDSLWVRWVHGVYTKGGRWELFNAPATASWVVKKLCKVKETLSD